jgi:hypothetical protein
MESTCHENIGAHTSFNILVSIFLSIRSMNPLSLSMRMITIMYCGHMISRCPMSGGGVCILVPIFKNKGDVQSCTNYQGIKLMSHTIKLWERIIEHCLRGVTNVTENQFGFMPGRSTMDAIYLIRQFMERCREQMKDLKKGYDKVSRNVMWWTLQKHKVSTKYITLIKDMYASKLNAV